MLIRWQTMRAWMGPQFVALLDLWCAVFRGLREDLMMQDGISPDDATSIAWSMTAGRMIKAVS